MATTLETPSLTQAPVTPRRGTQELGRRKKRKHWLNADRRQRIAVCSMAVIGGTAIDAFIGPALPSCPLACCGWLAIAGYTIAAGLLVWLWRIAGD